MVDTQTWGTLAQAYAFLGNSLLNPMSRTSDVGLDPEFWRAFPDFGDEGAAEAIARAVAYSEEARRRRASGADAVRDASVEYTHLFVGPPSPAAPPWETMYRRAPGSEASAGFGQATFEMRALLRAANLELRNENNQYEDHIGIELLYLSELCRRRAGGNADAAADDASANGMPTAKDDAAQNDASASDASVFSFIETHPSAWIGALRKGVEDECPEGYIGCVLGIAEALLRHHAKLLA